MAAFPARLIALAAAGAVAEVSLAVEPAQAQQFNIPSILGKIAPGLQQQGSLQGKGSTKKMTGGTVKMPKTQSFSMGKGRLPIGGSPTGGSGQATLKRK
jgi:hypothetical protein